MKRMRADSHFARVRQWTIACVAFLLGFLLALPPRCFPARQTISPNFNLFDGSWELEMPLRLARGAIAGRDFVFTYGPVYQLVHSPWFLGNVGDPAATLRFHGLWATFLISLGTWFVLRSTGASLGWRGPLFMLWSALWPPYYFYYKPLLGLLVVAACGWHAVGTISGLSTVGRSRSILVWMLSAPILTLYGFDLGVIVGAAITIFCFVAVSCTWRLSADPRAMATRRSILLAFGLAIGGGILFVFAATLPDSWRSYLPESWEIARSYPTMMARGGPRSVLGLIAVGFLGGTLLSVFACRVVRHCWWKGNWDDRRVLSLLAMSCFCLLWLRSGLTRSDSTHYRGSLAPLLFVAGCWLPCWFSTTAPRGNWRFLVVALPLVILSPAMKLPVEARMNAICAFELRPAWLNITQPDVREAVRIAELRTEPSLFVWPVESTVGLLAGKSNPAHTLQSYIAHTPHLEHLFVDSLRKTPALPVVFFRGRDELDGIEYLTRTPVIFRYLLQEYALDGPCQSRLAFLRRTPDRPNEWRTEPISGVSASFKPGAVGEVSLSKDQSAGWSASDFVLFKMRIAKTAMMGIGKPGHIAVTFTLSNGSERKQLLLLPHDGQIQEGLTSACTVRDPLFLSAFHPHKSWRARECVVGLKLEWVPIDVLSRRPAEIVLENVALLRRSGVEIREASLSEQDDEKLLEEFFGTGAVND